MLAYPMKMHPVLKDYLWGGERLVKEYGKHADKLPAAESWEVSCHPDGLSVVANGRYAGQPLRDVLNAHPEWIGLNFAKEQDFPVLIKLIDAKENLSLQVHPHDAYAIPKEGQPGKNEMWYILDAAPGACVILGCERPIAPAEMRERIAAGTLLEAVCSVPVQAGDCLQIPAGMLHGIGAGILLAEVQQSSNITYRVYDYERLDADGKPRELHIDRALEVIDPSLKGKKQTTTTERLTSFTQTKLTDWPYFQTVLLELSGSIELLSIEESFTALMILEGEVQLEFKAEKMMFLAGQSVFIPAGKDACTLQGKAKILQVRMCED